ncbi:glycosyltransferase family 4 protein [bacterium]|nr:glycosyltransferase family 4 protein [candidate division CSSED10-310 bacterium]
MKVAVVTTRHRAQDDRIYYKQALSLAKRMDVIMIAPEDHEDLVWASCVRFHPIPRRRSPPGRIRSLFEAVRAIRREKPDVCHLHDLDLVFAIPLIRVFTDSRIIYDAHEAFPEQIAKKQELPGWIRSPAAKVINIIEKTLVRMADRIITADDPTTRSFYVTGIPATTVFNYPDLVNFQNYESVDDRSGSVDCKRETLVYHGSITADRGLFHMIEAMDMIRQQYPGVLLKIVGRINQQLQGMAEERIRYQCLEKHIEFTGWIPYRAIADILRSCDIGLVPLQPNEKFKRNIPLKIFEYMACGLPIIAADLPPVRRYFSQVDCGILFDSTKPSELARCVIDLLGDPEKRRMFGQNGMRMVHCEWNWNQMERILFEIYESLILVRKRKKF